MAKERPRLLDDYTETFKLNVPGLLALGEEGLRGKYREVMTSQAQIAANQGFEMGWKFPSVIVVPESRRGVTFEPPAGDRYARPLRPSSIIVERFPNEAEKEPSADHLQYYSLAIAAGGFRYDESGPEGWVNVRKFGYTRRLASDYFVTRVVGKSMEPTIRDGAYCVFRKGVSGTRQNRVVLVRKTDYRDPDTGGNYTVKRYESTKAVTEEGPRNKTIRLIPDNPDRAVFPVLEFTPDDEGSLEVIAEFVQMLNTPDEGP